MLRNSLRAAFAEARAHTDQLFSLVHPDAIYERPIPERHRIIFYLGHLEAFDWNLVGRYGLDLPAFHAGLDKLFAFGIDPAVGNIPTDQPSDWPSVEEARSYNRRVRETVDSRLGDVPEQLVHVALEHRLMHAETFAYMLHHLPAERKEKPVDRGPWAVARSGQRFLEIPAGKATLGRAAEEGFGWDNEYVRHAVEVPAFAISKYKVTNGDYLAFVESGAEAPYFWRHDGKQWLLRAAFGERPLPLDWPVYVTHQQACAYAAWKGCSLPTEAQFHRAAYGTPEGSERLYPWGDREPGREHGNFDFADWDPAPVSAFPAGDSAFGVSGLLGDGWEWTSTLFEPFEGFQPFPFYQGYSANFFDGTHFVMKGGSPRTAARLLRRSFRNWFRPDYPYVYAGFRLVEN